MNKRLLTKIAMAGIIFASAMPTCASALTLTQGSPIIAIDGDTDGDVAVTIMSIGGTSSYTYGYFLNHSSTFVPVSPASSAIFQGGDIIDFALYDGSKYFTLSGDLLDNSYSVLMTFANEITTGAPQQPADWDKPFYYNANITWTLPPNVINTNELALNFRDSGNDGIAPVPEPATLLMMGGGLVGYGLMRRRKKA